MLRPSFHIILLSLALMGSASAQVTSQITGITVGGPGAAIPVQKLTDADLIKQTADGLNNLKAGTCTPQNTELLYWSGGNFSANSSETILNGIVEKLQGQKFTLTQLGTDEDEEHTYLFFSGENGSTSIVGYFVAGVDGFLTGWCGNKVTATKPPKLQLPGTQTQQPTQPQQPQQPTQQTTTPTQPAATQSKPGYISGRVLDTQGRPLKGAKVYISGTTFAQGQKTNFETTTGADGTYSLRVPDGRYSGKATHTSVFGGVTFGYILFPLSGDPGTEVDSTEGGTLDFQWKLTGRTAYSAAGADSPSSFYGVSIDLSYCGLPARAYCDYKYTELVKAVGEGTVEFTLTPTGPLADGTTGKPVKVTYPLSPLRTDYPNGQGGGRLVLGQSWEYHGIDWNDIPLGSYTLTATIRTPDGKTVPLKLGLKDSDVEHASVPITWKPWDNFNPGSYIGGGVNQLKIYIRD